MLYKTIRLVTFDVTNTLLHFRVAPGYQYAEVASKFGVQFNPDHVARDFKIQYKHMVVNLPNFGRNNNVHWEEWWRKLIRRTFDAYIEDKKVIEDVATYLIESYKTVEFWKVDEGTIDTLEYLKSTGVVVGVISNFDPRLKDVLENTGLLKYFNFVLGSYDAGYEKPDAEIFLKALLFSRLVKVHPYEALHVGDDVELDFLGARRAGWQAVVVANGEPNIYAKHAALPEQNIVRNLSIFNEYIRSVDIFRK